MHQRAKGVLSRKFSLSLNQRKVFSNQYHDKPQVVTRPKKTFSSQSQLLKSNIFLKILYCPYLSIYRQIKTINGQTFQTKDSQSLSKKSDQQNHNWDVYSRLKLESRVGLGGNVKDFFKFTLNSQKIFLYKIRPKSLISFSF